MNLTEKLERSVDLLQKNGEIERKKSLSKFITNLNKSLDEFLRNGESELYRSTPEFVELSAQIDLSDNKSFVTKKWIEEKANLVNLKFTKFAKKEKEQLTIELVKARLATKAIEEIKTAPKQKAQKLFSELANLDEKTANEKLKKMKPKEFEEFCINKGIAIELNAKGKFDRKKTTVNAETKIQKERDSLKL